jgi:hypothetical protein
MLFDLMNRGFLMGIKEYDMELTQTTQRTMSVVWPDGQPWDMILFSLAAVAVVLLQREAMFSRAGAVTEVLLPDDEGQGR